MANTFNKALITLFFSSSIILSFFVQTKQENPCPYPCYPPPTGTGGGGGGSGGTGTGTVTQTPPASYSPPSPPSQTGLYPPPGTSYPTPTGNLPYSSPPPYGNSFNGQPPPDAILPYFPYYYRKPPRQTDEESSATSIPGKSLLLKK
ncbi:hypothetical protein DITRI_Ditri12bG0039200 [Diplodiscus trichospermus]